MKKIAMGLTLAVTSTCALANWTEVASSDDGKVTYFADPATIRRIGPKVKVWTLTDYKEARVLAGDVQFLSTKVQEEFDCVEQTARHLNMSAFSANMGNGKLVGSEKNPDKGRPVTQESVTEEMWKFACGKK